MNNATITKTLKKVNESKKNYSLGFSRWSSLPAKVRKNLDLAIYLKNDHIDNMHAEKNEMFESMTESEFVNWMKTA